MRLVGGTFNTLLFSLLVWFEHFEPSSEQRKVRKLRSFEVRCSQKCLDKYIPVHPDCKRSLQPGTVCKNKKVRKVDCIEKSSCFSCTHTCEELDGIVHMAAMQTICSSGNCKEGCRMACRYYRKVKRKSGGPSNKASKDKRFITNLTSPVEDTDLSTDQHASPVTSGETLEQSTAEEHVNGATASMSTTSNLKRTFINSQKDQLKNPTENNLSNNKNTLDIGKQRTTKPNSPINYVSNYVSNFEEGDSAHPLEDTSDELKMVIEVDVEYEKSGKAHAVVFWQRSEEGTSVEAYTVHWGVQSCGIVAGFSSCDVPNYKTTRIIGAEKNLTTSLPNLYYNAEYWLTISTGQRTSHRRAFTTVPCRRPEEHAKLCKPSDLLTNSHEAESAGKALLLNMTCHGFLEGKGTLSVQLQWYSTLYQGTRYQLLYHVTPTHQPQNTRSYKRDLNATQIVLALQLNSIYDFQVFIDDMDVESNHLLVNTTLVENNGSSHSGNTCSNLYQTSARVSAVHQQAEIYPVAIIVPMLAALMLVLGVCYGIYKKRLSIQDIRINKTVIVKNNSYYKTSAGVVPRAAEGSGFTEEMTLLMTDEWEVDPKQVKVGPILGQGAFGKVMSGYYQDERVAIKLLKDNLPMTYREDLLFEISVMKRVSNHPHIVAMMGARTLQEPIALIMEYVPYGNLQNFLKKCRLEGEMRMRDSTYQLVYNVNNQRGDEEVWTISPNDMLSFARQICLAMEHIANLHFVHRDLAARNVLVGPGKIVKVCDFGLCRCVHEDGEYHKLTTGKLPLKWMALESLRERLFTVSSDVWSFGIVLWEITTMGASPYPNVALADLYTLLSNGYRMDKPKNCSAELYDIMCQCWYERPSDRPSFSCLRRQLETLLGKGSDYLELVNIDAPIQSSECSSTPSSCSVNGSFSADVDVTNDDHSASTADDIRCRPDSLQLAIASENEAKEELDKSRLSSDSGCGDIETDVRFYGDHTDTGHSHFCIQNPYTVNSPTLKQVKDMEDKYEIRPCPYETIWINS